METIFFQKNKAKKHRHWVVNFPPFTMKDVLSCKVRNILLDPVSCHLFWTVEIMILRAAMRQRWRKASPTTFYSLTTARFPDGSAKCYGLSFCLSFSGRPPFISTYRAVQIFRGWEQNCPLAELSSCSESTAITGDSLGIFVPIEDQNIEVSEGVVGFGFLYVLYTFLAN